MLLHNYNCINVLISGLMDQQTLSSNTITKKTDPRYIAGVLKDGELDTFSSMYTYYIHVHVYVHVY